MCGEVEFCVEARKDFRVYELFPLRDPIHNVKRLKLYLHVVFSPSEHVTTLVMNGKDTCKADYVSQGWLFLDSTGIFRKLGVSLRGIPSQMKPTRPADME